jgi:DNA-directed RNA polymerase specialized sigma24 family protein
MLVNDKLSLPFVMQDLSAEQQISLAERIVQGYRDAENELVAYFSPRILAMLCARTRDREASRDLLHDVLITVLRALRKGQLRQLDRLAAFVQGITRNTAQSYARGRNLREQPLAEEPPAARRGDAVEESQRAELVRLALEELDSTDREILLRTLVEGQKSGLIARDLESSGIYKKGCHKASSGSHRIGEKP